MLCVDELAKEPRFIRPGCRLLRAVAGYERAGASTTDLARTADLARSTTHRLLSALVAERLLDRDPAAHEPHPSLSW